MFSISDIQDGHTCQGFTRRDFLRVGSLGLGGMTLPGLLSVKAAAAEAGIPVTGKSVVLLFLQGGPPHIEFFDPKMSAPSEYRSITGEIKTTLPGITFGSTFPKLAKRAHKLAVVRSYGSKNSGHTYLKVTSGNNKMKAAMGAVYNRVAGANNRDTGMPNNVLLLPESVQPGLRLGGNFETNALKSLTDPGLLGSSMGAFDPSGGGQLQQDMELRMPPERLKDRVGLLGSLDQLRRKVDESGGMETVNRYQQQAYELQLAALTLTLALTGCAGSPDVETDGAALVTAADVTIVVWSSNQQGPVGATGVVVFEGDGSTTPLDTRNDPAGGHTLHGMTPGRYRVDIERRFEGDLIHEVNGSEAVYLEPGPSEITVVVDDREDELG